MIEIMTPRGKIYLKRGGGGAYVRGGVCLVGGVFSFALRLVGWDFVVVVLFQRMVLELVCAVNLKYFESSFGCFKGLGWSEGIVSDD